MSWNATQTTLGDETCFRTLNGLWKGKKPPFVEAGVIRNTNFTESGRIDFDNIAWLEVEENQLAKRQLEAGDIIIERSGGGPKQPVGRVVFFDRNDGRFSFSNFTSAIRVGDRAAFDAKFVFYSLLELYQSGQTEDLQRRTTGIRNLDFSAYKERAVFPRIPLPEQRKIAGVLGLVQRAMEQQERLIEKTAELKKTLLHQLFTQGTRGEPQKQTDLGPIPESWEVVKLGSLVNFQTGKLNSNAATPGGKFPFFTCSQETFWIDHFAFDTEALLLSGNNAQGIYSVKRFKGKFNAYQRTYVITLKDQSSVSYSFLHQALSRNLERLRTLSIGTATKYLTMGILLNLPVPKPGFNESEAIGDSLSKVEAKLAHHRRKHATLSALFRTLLHQLMTAQLRVHDLDLDGIR